MWIRSQDKKILAYCTRLAIVGKTIQNLPPTMFEDDYDRLGTYETKERALEVLDNIQSQLQRTVEVIREVSSENYKQQFVFQMPRE